MGGELVVSQPTIDKLRHLCLGLNLRQGSAFVEAVPKHQPETQSQHHSDIARSEGRASLRSGTTLCSSHRRFPCNALENRGRVLGLLVIHVVGPVMMPFLRR